MAARPRLLFLAQALPYPPHSGVANRTFNILRQLQLAYDIDLVAFARVSHQPDRAAREAAWRALQDVATVVAEPTPIPHEHSALRKLWDHLRSVLSGRAYTHYVYESDAFRDRLHDVLRRRRPDLVHLDSLDLARWLPALPPVPTACTHHDIDFELLRQRAERTRSTVLRRYLRFQADRVERLVREVCPRLALNVMMSELDARRLRALAPHATTVVVPNGTDTEYFQPGRESVAGRVVFVGPTYNHPNWDAVEFLLQDIWPKVHTADRSTSLRLIGRSAPSDQARYNAEPGVTTLGYVTDVRPPLSEARCCVVPIRIGGGTRLKILDAWAMGQAVVSTAIGAEGLAARDGDNILVRDTPEAFAAAVLQVLSDARLRARLGEHARRTAVEHYSWSVIGRRICSAYDGLLGRPAVPAARLARAADAIPRRA
ncbi:MAG TPA: glycosyltransferase family 4 protein [Gemmatimonadales bacterium]|jgi:glycosyltransferase involved in cell wall biosynthesis|nr:glycosyltransferase family 4 protein [Gemmatimonadales bacterium]